MFLLFQGCSESFNDLITSNIPVVAYTGVGIAVLLVSTTLLNVKLSNICIHTLLVTAQFSHVASFTLMQLL